MAIAAYLTMRQAAAKYEDVPRIVEILERGGSNGLPVVTTGMDYQEGEAAHGKVHETRK